MAAFRSIRPSSPAGLFLALLLFPLCGTAQPASVDSLGNDTTGVEWEHPLPPLTVTAGRLPIPPAQAPARIEVLDSTALARTGAASVASALEARAGLHVRRYGPGGLATPALRGSGASQTALLLDGRPISNPQIGHLDLSLLPTVLLRSIEVLHGPASPLHGSDGLGGAVHLRTLQPHSSPQVRGTAHTGAFGQRGGSLLAGAPLSDETSVLAAADVQSTEGDFPYRDATTYPPQTTRRQNADRTRRSVFARVQSQVSSHRLRLSGWMTRAERGLPPTTSTASARERQWDTQIRLWGRDRRPLANGTLTLRGMTQHTRVRYANPAQDVDQTGRTWTHSLESTLEHPLTDRWRGVGGLSGSWARARHPQLDAAAHQEHLAAFAEGTGTYGRVRLYPALRADRYWMPQGRPRLAMTPRLGLNLQPFTDWSAFRLKAQVARAFRVPTFNDRYWQPGGNPNLQPERSWGADVGLRYDHPQGHIEVTAFGHRRRDQIVWEPTGSDYWAPQNIARVRSLGGDLSVEWRWTLPGQVPLQTGLTYTLTDARTRSNPESASYDEPLRYVPRDQIKAHSTLSWGPAALTVHARYTGRRYVTSDGSQHLDAYVVARTRLQVEHTVAGVRTALSATIDNLFDTDYRSVGNRPMPPRHAQLRLHIAL